MPPGQLHQSRSQNACAMKPMIKTPVANSPRNRSRRGETNGGPTLAADPKSVDGPAFMAGAPGQSDRGRVYDSGERVPGLFAKFARSGLENAEETYGSVIEGEANWARLEGNYFPACSNFLSRLPGSGLQRRRSQNGAASVHPLTGVRALPAETVSSG